MTPTVERIPDCDMTRNHEPKKAEQTADGNTREARRLQMPRRDETSHREHRKRDETEHSEHQEVVTLRELAPQYVGNRSERVDVTNEYLKAKDNKGWADKSDGKKRDGPI